MKGTETLHRCVVCSRPMHKFARGLGGGAHRRDGVSARGSSYGPKGHESIAQASAGLQPGFYISNGTAVKGRQKSCYATPNKTALIFTPFRPVTDLVHSNGLRSLSEMNSLPSN
jgi:hypothetical protein